MSERWVGFVVSGAQIHKVDLDVPAEGALVLNAQASWTLPAGDRPKAYANVAQRVRDYLTQEKVRHVVVKASALAQARPKMAHLESAELRGVVMAAAAHVAETRVVSKAATSKTYGKRKVDAYLEDDEFWTENVQGPLAAGRREAALLVLTQVRPQ